MPLPYASHLEANHGVLALFEQGVFSSRVRLRKPDAALFAHAAEQFGIAPGNAVLIDDLAANVEAARRAGWRGVVFDEAARCEAALGRLEQG